MLEPELKCVQFETHILKERESLTEFSRNTLEINGEYTSYYERQEKQMMPLSELFQN